MSWITYRIMLSKENSMELEGLEAQGALDHKLRSSSTTAPESCHLTHGKAVEDSEIKPRKLLSFRVRVQEFIPHSIYAASVIGSLG